VLSTRTQRRAKKDREDFAPDLGVAPVPLSDFEAKHLFDLIDERKGYGAVVICSQIEMQGWYEEIGVK
jgi:hypothetical protein